MGDCQIQPGTDYRADDLAGAHLHRADLHGANLTDANLANADLTYASLKGATITKFDVPAKADCLKQEKPTAASGLPPSGSTRVRVPCDANRIVVEMIASKGASRVSQKVAVKTGIT
ncbi:MAG: pentapeptide repeat-containing protein [Actinomycetota bacterium]